MTRLQVIRRELEEIARMAEEEACDATRIPAARTMYGRLKEKIDEAINVTFTADQEVPY